MHRTNFFKKVSSHSLMGNPTVDFLSLDTEGGELEVLETLPWDQVDIRAISVETHHQAPHIKDRLFTLLRAEGFSHLGSLALDDIFVRLEAGGLSPQQTVREVMTRRTRRLCQYSRVPLAQLASHCATTWPRDFYRHQTFSWDLHALLLQTTSDFCPWSLESQAGQTLKSRVASLAGWPRWLGVTVPEATKNLTV